MLKKVIFAAALLLTSAAGFAQRAVGTTTIQPKVGLNIATVTNSDADCRLGLAAGVEAEHQFTDLFALSVGLLYSQQGGKITESYSVGPYSGSVKSTAKLDYINVPVLANVYVAKGLAVKLGLQPGFKVSGKSSETVTVGSKEETRSKTIEGLKTFDLSLPVGVSYEYKNVVLDARYNWGLTKMADGKDSGKNSVFQITLGYKFAL